MLENYCNVDATWTTPKTVLWPCACIHVCAHEAAHTCTDSERKKDTEREVRKQKADRPKQNKAQQIKTNKNTKQKITTNKNPWPPFPATSEGLSWGSTHLHPLSPGTHLYSLCGRSQRRVTPSVHSRQLWWWPCKTELAQDLTQTCPSHRKFGFSVVRPLPPQRYHNPQMGRAR